nr:uncharacterized protein LOC126522898 [Dermacentor andersoni]XP_054922585.1 uncharacterized protein LOC126522898 [Dermacentor andersoni]
MVTLLGSRHVRIGKVPNLSLCFVRLCVRHLPSSRGDICAGCLSLRVQNSARCGIEEVVLCLGARMRLDTDISCLLSTGVQQSTRIRNLLMRQVAVVLELRRGLLPAMGPSLSSYRSIVALKVQKSMVEAVAKVPTRKTASIKGSTPLISTTGHGQHIEHPRLKPTLSRKLVLHNFAAALRLHGLWRQGFLDMVMALKEDAEATGSSSSDREKVPWGTSLIWHPYLSPAAFVST